MRGQWAPRSYELELHRDRHGRAASWLRVSIDERHGRRHAAHIAPPPILLVAQIEHTGACRDRVGDLPPTRHVEDDEAVRQETWRGRALAGARWRLAVGVGRDQLAAETIRRFTPFNAGNHFDRID